MGSIEACKHVQAGQLLNEDSAVGYRRDEGPATRDAALDAAARRLFDKSWGDLMADWERVGRTPSDGFVAAMERAGRELLAESEKVIAPQAAHFSRSLRTEVWEKIGWWIVLLAIVAAPFIIIARTLAPTPPIPQDGTFPAILRSIDKFVDDDFLFSATLDDGSYLKVLVMMVPLERRVTSCFNFHEGDAILLRYNFDPQSQEGRAVMTKPGAVPCRLSVIGIKRI